MTKKEITIGILDIDANFTKTAREALEKDGFSVLVYPDYEQLFANSKLRKFDVIIIECLTQKISLQSLIKNLKSSLSYTPVYLFVSFVLDKNSIKDVLLETQSQDFFKKPVKMDEVLKVINEKFKNIITQEESDPFRELLYATKNTNQEKLKSLQSVQILNGNDAPRLLSMALRVQYSGSIQFKSPEGQVSTITMNRGSVTKVEVNDPKSFFGALLVDKNFVTLEELEVVLQQKNNKRIGEKLVEANLISPHVIDIINIEQLGIRLGYVIKNTNYEITWDEQSPSVDNTVMDLLNFQRFMSDWLTSKIEMKWLKTFFMPDLDSKIAKGVGFQDISGIYQLEPLSRMPKFSQFILQDTTLGKLIETKMYLEEDVYKAAYLLASQEYISFNKKEKASDVTHHVERLKKIKEDMDTQNYFETLGLNDKAKGKEIKKNYYELSKLFHPDKVSTSKNSDVKILTQYIFSKISKAYEVLSDDSQRASYLKELEKGNAEKILESESLFEEGRSLLKSNQPSRALPLLEKAMSLRPPTSELRLHLLWAKLQLITGESSPEYLRNVEVELNHIPPEDRHNANYYFVKGLYSKVAGDFSVAEKHIKHALSMQPNLIEAQRELNILSLQKKGSKQVDILNADLKDVVGLLFKKKK